MKFPLIAALAATTILSGLAPGKAHAAPGDLYVASSGNSTIVRITPGGVASVFAHTRVAVGYDYPAHLAFDGSGNLYVANNHEEHGYGPVPNDDILRFTPSGVRSVFSNVGREPTGLAFDASGNLYVANASLDIERITPDGVASVFADTGLNQPLGVARPEGLAFDASGNLYASLLSFSTSPFSSTIERFTPAGVASVFASTGLNDPQGLAFDASGNLYASLLSPSSYSATIERFTPGGGASVFANIGGRPGDLAFDASGALYVSNSDNTIERFTPGGVGSVFATSGAPLYQPSGLAFEPVVGPTAVPEPASLALLAVGVAGLGLTRRKRVRAAGSLA